MTMRKYNFKNFEKILILGDVFLDIFQTTEIIKISPERPVPVLEPTKIINLLGGAANVANNIQSVGGSTFLISKVSILVLIGTSSFKVTNFLLIKAKSLLFIKVSFLFF